MASMVYHCWVAG